MNLGAFAVVIAVARKTRSGEISQLRRPVRLRPRPGRGHDVLPLLAGRHPAARRLDRQVRRVQGRCSPPAAAGPSILAVIGAVNSVIALFYYANVAREMLMNPVPDGDATPGPGAAVARGRARHHRRRHAARRRAAQRGAALRRPVHLPAPGRRSADLARGDAWPSGSPATAPCPSTRSSTPRSTTPTTASTPAGARPAGGATSSPAPEVGPLFGAVLARALDAGGSSWAAPIRSSWSRPAPARARWPAACWRPARRALPALRYVLVERSAAQRARHADGLPLGAAGRGLRRRHAATTTDDEDEHRAPTLGIGPLGGEPGRAAGGARSPAWSWPTSCSTTSPFGLVVWDGGWQEARVGARSRRRLRGGARAGRAGRCPPACPATAAARRPRPGAARRGRLAAHRPRPARAGPGRGHRLHRRTRRRMAAPAVAGVAAHLPGPRARRAPAAAPGHAGHHLRGRPRPAGRRCRSPTPCAPRPQFLALHGIDDWWPRAAGVWTERAARRPTSPRCGPAAGSREAEALTDPAGLGALLGGRVGPPIG